MKPAHIKLTLFAMLVASVPSNAEAWRGLIIAPENRCSEYNKKRSYPYSQSVESKIIASMNGQIYGPYTGRTFTSKRQTDIEHIVATSEAHDSGLCDSDRQTRRFFASDLLNLTLAAPKVNRCSSTGKCGKDAAEWLPERNKCWFAQRVIEVRLKYNLTIDRVESNALDAVLSKCSTTDMVIHQQSTYRKPTIDVSAQKDDALVLYDDNRNGRITCKEARKHGIAPVSSSHHAYPYMRDGDGDGIVC